MVKAPAILGRNPCRKQVYDRERRELKPWRSWYGTARWRRMRMAQLRREPLCRMHKAQGHDVEANTADHVVPHRGDPHLFWHGELQSLCDGCHSSLKQREERAASRAGPG